MRITEIFLTRTAPSPNSRCIWLQPKDGSDRIEPFVFNSGMWQSLWGVQFDPSKYFTKEEIESTYVPLTTLQDNYITAEQIAETYATKESIPTELPNPEALSFIFNTVNKGTYDGSSPLEISIEAYGSNLPMSADDTTSIQTYIDRHLLKTEAAELYQPIGDYALKSELPSLEGYATEAWVEAKNYLTAIPEEYITETELALAIAGFMPATEINDKFNALDFAEVTAPNGKKISAVSQTDGLINVSVTDITVNDIPSLPQSKIEGLTDALNLKQNSFTTGTGLEMVDNVLNITLDTSIFYVVSSLPESPVSGNEKKICLVPTEPSEESDEYTEYLWVIDQENPSGHWEKLGQFKPAIDLTPYLTKQEALATYLSITDAQSTYATQVSVNEHTSNMDNPHNVTKEQVGLGNVDNTSDADKPISTAVQQALDGKQAAGDYATNTTLNSHIQNTENPHQVTKAQVGLSNVDNTSDLDKPISNAVQEALNTKQDAGDYVTEEEFVEHTDNDNNPHNVTKAQVGLGNVDNTSDADKPISTATQEALDKIKEALPVIVTVPELTRDYNIPANGTSIEYDYIITVGATQYDITADSSVRWLGGNAPVTLPNKIYVVSVVNNLGVWGEF